MLAASQPLRQQSRESPDLPLPTTMGETNAYLEKGLRGASTRRLIRHIGEVLIGLEKLFLVPRH